jgi:hypothetical protein
MEIIWGQWLIGKMIDGVEHYKIDDNKYTTDKMEAMIKNTYWTKGSVIIDYSDCDNEYIIDVKN